MVNSGLVSGCASEHLWLPGIEVRIKVDHRDGPVGSVDGAQKRQNDGMISPEGNDARMMLSVGRDGHERLASRGVIPEGGEGFAMEQGLVSLLNLLDGELVVIWRDGYVAAVYNF